MAEYKRLFCPCGHDLGRRRVDVSNHRNNTMCPGCHQHIQIFYKDGDAFVKYSEGRF